MYTYIYTQTCRKSAIQLSPPLSFFCAVSPSLCFSCARVSLLLSPSLSLSCQLQDNVCATSQPYPYMYI